MLDVIDAEWLAESKRVYIGWRIAIGYDNSFIEDGDTVYLIDHATYPSFREGGPLQLVDYFHTITWLLGVVGQMYVHKIDVPSSSKMVQK